MPTTRTVTSAEAFPGHVDVYSILGGVAPGAALHWSSKYIARKLRTDSAMMSSSGRVSRRGLGAGPWAEEDSACNSACQRRDDMTGVVRQRRWRQLHVHPPVHAHDCADSHLQSALLCGSRQASLC